MTDTARTIMLSNAIQDILKVFAAQCRLLSCLISICLLQM